MNTLERFILTYSMDEVKMMNILQGSGIVSDLAVLAKDVHESDCKKAVDFLVATLPRKIEREIRGWRDRPNPTEFK